MRTFRIEQFISENDSYHFNRATIHSNERAQRQDHFLHDHNYPEVFWIEQGKGVHLINGVELLIEPGSLVMMRPSDVHTFYCSSQQEGLTIANVAFHPSSLAFYQQRYFSKKKVLFWKAGRLPFNTIVSKDNLKSISLKANKTLKMSGGNLDLDQFLLFIFKTLSSHENIDKNFLPVWLNNTLEVYKTPKHFQTGVEGFVKLAGRSGDYINKVLQKELGLTITQTINRARMAYVVDQLTVTDCSLKIIAKDCGFSNMGHFYKVFKEYYHETPSRFRKLNNTIL